SRGLYEDVQTFGEGLKDAGYQLYFSGKWHVSNVESPTDRGWNVIWGTEKYAPAYNRAEYSEWQMYNNRPIDQEDTVRNEGEIIRPGYTHYCQYGNRENPFGDFDTTQAAVEQLRCLKGANVPFALYVGPLGPHDPYVVPKRFLDLYPRGSLKLPDSYEDSMEDKPTLYRRTRSRYDQLTREEQEESLRHYYAFCSYEDYLFGLVLEELEKAGRKENTVVLYLSDHGDYAGAHGLWAKGLPSFRQAYNICAMVGGAGVVNPGRSENCMVSLADFAPTILELAGAPVPEGLVGKSLVPFLQNCKPPQWRELCFTQTNGNEVYGIQRAVWSHKWKYVFNTFDFDELYDLENDPDELHNLIYEAHPERGPHREIIRKMCQEMWRFAYDTHDTCVNPYIMTAMAPYGPGILKSELGFFD
ncbi:MAG: sulfatase-like hydrolase/transferase, partial [Angelakisella sp.]